MNQQPNQSNRITAINVYDNNRTAHCVAIIDYLLQKEEPTGYDEEQKYKAIAYVASILGFSALMNQLNGMKSPLKDPYAIGMVSAMRRIESYNKTYDSFFDGCANFIKAYRDMASETFEMTQPMRENITQIFDAFTDRDAYEKRQIKIEERLNPPADTAGPEQKE